MRIGTVFPQTEIGNDPVAIRDFAQAGDLQGVGLNVSGETLDNQRLLANLAMWLAGI